MDWPVFWSVLAAFAAWNVVTFAASFVAAYLCPRCVRALVRCCVRFIAHKS